MEMGAAGILTQARINQSLTMNALADLSGVPAATISRIEAGKVEPTWSTMSKLLGAAGFKLTAEVSQTGSDEPFAALLRRIDIAERDERIRLIRRFPDAAMTARVARRTGARAVELSQSLGDVLDTLEQQGQQPVVSSMEAFAAYTDKALSFSPVIYIERPELADFAPSSMKSPKVMWLLPTTSNVREVIREVVGRKMVRHEWAMLDSLASPGRQFDGSLPFLRELMEQVA